MRMTRPTVPSCGTCAAAWDDPTARYCGRCGQPLRPATHDHTVTDGRDGAPHRTRLVLIVLGLSAVLVVVTLLVSVSLSQVGTGSSEPDTDVDLPDRGVLGSSDPAVAPADADGPDEAGSDMSPHLADLLTCRPEGCVRWQVDMGPGIAVPIGDQLGHVTRDRGRYR